MSVHFKNTGAIIPIGQNNYLAQGGEGRVYVHGDQAIKIYHNPANMVPVGKISELEKIQDDAVIRPLGLVCEDSGRVVGYHMRYLSDVTPLCAFFPQSFKTREGINGAKVTTLVESLRDRLVSVHKAGVLAVDLNEMNVVASPKTVEAYLIDTDSFQTKSFPATAIMDSIRDWLVRGNQWTDLSDWYSFAILSFQLFTGIHPFRGKYHGTEKRYKEKIAGDDVDDTFAITRRRMVENISVFHQEVGVPASANLAAIPKEYATWYRRLFESGKREPPPFGQVVFVAMAPVAVVNGKTIQYETTLTLSNLAMVFSVGERLVTRSHDGQYTIDGKVGQTVFDFVAVGKSPVTDIPVGAKIDNQTLSMIRLDNGSKIDTNCSVFELSCSGGFVYVRTHDAVWNVNLTEIGGTMMASLQRVVNTTRYASWLFNGVVIQDLLGCVYVSVLLGGSHSQQIRIKELDQSRVQSAKYERGVLVVVVEKANRYHRYIYKIDGSTAHLFRTDSVESGHQANFAVLDSGVVVLVHEEEKILIFRAEKSRPEVAEKSDQTLGNNLVLFTHRGGLCCFDDRSVSKMSMTK